MKSRNDRFKDLTELLIGVGIIIAVNVVASFTLFRADLTTEKRHTLTEATKEMVQELKEVVFVKVYLHGELPADLSRLEQSTRELLDELRANAPGKIEYEFIDPSASADEKIRTEVYGQLQKEGLNYTSIRLREKGAFSERIVFPGALITYLGRTRAVQLLRSTTAIPNAETVNRSINNLEYEMASAIRQVTTQKRPRIAFLEGHGEADALETGDILKALGELYDVQRKKLDGQLNSLSEKPEGATYRLNSFDLIIIAAPDSVFTPKDRFIIDQYIMNGGKVLWFVDPMNAHLDSLRTQQTSIATNMDLGLDELFFAYGVRLNKDIILDRNCAPIEIFTTPYGEQRKLERFPWYFEPIIASQTTHPIVNNIDPMHLRFVSSMDTLGTPGIKKTVLLRSSKYSRILRNPVRISLNIVNIDPDMQNSQTNLRPVAVLLEGNFTSAYKDRYAPTFEDSVKNKVGFREEGRKTAMLVVSDGDMIVNRVDRDKGMYFTLGYDRYAKSKIYGNREFVINAVNYLLDDKSLISVRSRTIVLRQLAPQKVMEEATGWKVMNMVAPVLLVILAGIGLNFARKRRYARP